MDENRSINEAIKAVILHSLHYRTDIARQDAIYN